MIILHMNIVLVLGILHWKLLYLLVTITTVNLVILEHLILLQFTLRIHYGMVNNAFLTIIAVVEPVSHGFSINYLLVRKSI